MRSDFEAYFAANLPSVASFHPHFNEALAWVLRAGGKHFRAQLVLGVVEAYAPEKVRSAFDVALAVELLHTYSLIHDDLPAMDNAPLRRGVATLHVKYDEVTAILAGDALNTEAFLVLARAPLDEKIRLACVETLGFCGGLNGMVIGQAVDCFFEKKPLNLEELKFLHAKKTGALIAGSMKMGALVAGLSHEECEWIFSLGLKLGLAFQVHDDVLDATATTEAVGKPVLNDGVKNSFTNLLGVEGAVDFRDSLEKEILAELTGSPLFGLVKGLIEKYLK